METTAHFDNIPGEITKQLSAANQEIVIAVDRFTDRTLFDMLCQQAGRGLLVRLAVMDDQVNADSERLNLQRLQDIGGEVFLIPADGDRDSITDHRFCVIDRSTVIIGSYDWSPRAQGSDNSITVINSAAEIAAEHLNAFDALLSKYGLSTTAIDTPQLCGLLEGIGNLLLLEDWEAISLQLDKIRTVNTELHLAPLFNILEERNSWSAIEWIDEYLNRNGTKALVISTDQEIAFLRLTLRGLECQFTALSHEKAEIDRVVHAFSLLTSHEVGDLLTRYLELQAEKLRRQAAIERDAEEEANRAREDYEQYRAANESSREKMPPPQLTPGDLKELKRLYREASQKCHPDKVNEADREQASHLFVQLQAAYRNCDLTELRAIHAAVREGNMFAYRNSYLAEAESLYRAIAILRLDLEQLSAEIHDLRQTEAYRTSKTVNDWDTYFARKRVALQQAIEKLQAELTDHVQEA